MIALRLCDSKCCLGLGSWYQDWGDDCLCHLIKSRNAGFLRNMKKGYKYLIFYRLCATTATCALCVCDKHACSSTVQGREPGFSICYRRFFTRTAVVAVVHRLHHLHTHRYEACWRPAVHRWSTASTTCSQPLRNSSTYFQQSNTASATTARILGTTASR